MAIQGDQRISEPLRTKIREFAQQEGYFPNDLAWGLRTGRTGLLGIVVPLTNSGFVSGLLDGAIQTFWEAGYFPVTLCSGLDLEAEARMLESLARQRVEGVLLMPSREDSGKRHFAQLLKEHVSIVAINNPVPKLDLPLVASDDVLGGELATQHLIEAGHRRIFHLASPLDSRYADRRREIGYSCVMKNAGLRPGVLHYKERLGWDGNDEAFHQKLLKLISDQKSTAVFCFNDSVALKVYEFCHKAGIRIPDDLSIVGYSNESWQGMNSLDFVSPPLTTVDQNTRKMGQTAAHLLLKLINDHSTTPMDALVEPRLVQRASVKKL